MHRFLVNKGHGINGHGIYEPFSRKAVLRGPNLLVDGDCEAATFAAWIATGSPALTKETASPYQGTRWAKIAYNGTNNPSIYQAILTAGHTYRLIGVAKGDGGTGNAMVWNPTLGAIWMGTTSASWQVIGGATGYVEFVAASPNLQFYNQIAGAGYCGYDALDCYEV